MRYEHYHSAAAGVRDTASIPPPTPDAPEPGHMATWSTGKNVTTSPLIITPEGRVLGGGEWAPIKANEMPCSRHIKYGRLLVVVRPEGASDSELEPGAVAAWNETDALNAAAGGTTPKPAPPKNASTSGPSSTGTDTTTDPTTTA